MTENPSRQPAGVPTGGQFAAAAKSESEVALVVQHGAGHLALTNDGRAVPGFTCPECGNGYASQAGLDAHPCEGAPEGPDPMPPAALTPRDVEHLVEHKGVFENGYDQDDVNRVLSNFEAARLVCTWDTHDDLGYGGDSEFVGIAKQDLGVTAHGHHATTDAGVWRRIHPQVWEYLSDPDSDLDPESIPSLLADEPFERQDIDDLPGDGWCNIAYETDGEECTHCGGPTDDGEGWDGYCGTCEDLRTQHDADEHAGRPDEDCPDCVHVFTEADAMRKAAKGEA